MDGEPLSQILGPFIDDDDVTDAYVSVLVTNWPADVALEDLDRLLGADAPPQLGGRTAFYICAECGALGCGTVTAVVDVNDDKVVWRDFGYQNDYEPFEPGALFAGIGPFTFDREAYSVALSRFRAVASRGLHGPGDAGAPESTGKAPPI